MTARPRSSSANWQRLYKTARWRKLREAQLKRQPLCECDHHKGLDPDWPANVVDHTTAHKGNRKLFFDPANLRSMAKECHDRFAQSRDKGGSGFLSGCDVNGVPLSDSHHWNE